MNFFIATVGRSGSTWLSHVLNKSESHTVLHEVADGRNPDFIHPHSPFPIERFARPNYGEVHGFLRYNLSAGMPGSERLIPRRGLLRRDTKSLIQSWMNRDKRMESELAAVIFEVTTQQRLLDEWAKSDELVRVFKFEELTTELTALEDLCDWLEIGYTPVESDINTVINSNNPKNHIFDWDKQSEHLYKIICSRQGLLDKDK